MPHARERVFCISPLGGKALDFNKLRFKLMRDIKEFMEYGP